MKWAVVFIASGPWARPDMALALAEAADQNGVESLWQGDHIVMPAEYDSIYPYSPTGKFGVPGAHHGEEGYGEEQNFPDPLIHFALMAAVTKQVRFGTGVVILPQREPCLLAKQCATLDYLTNGRFMLGTGVGWLREEIEATGTPWPRRGARHDEYVAAMRALWREREATFHGDFVNFDRMICNPHPVQPGGVPIHIGGHTSAAARRAGRIGDGFFPAILGDRPVKEVLPELLGEMRTAAVAAGRDPDAIEITSGGPRRVEGVSWYADHGVHRLTIRVRSETIEGMREELGRFSDEVISKTN